MTVVIFDLDGTLSDPAQGIVTSLNHALASLGLPARPTRELLRYVGPPLHVTFAEVMSTPDEQTIASAIAFYRERYIRIGYAENRLYDGIAEVLESLREEGLSLCVATFKRKDIAQQVLRHFGIADLFSEVYGCDMDRTKADLLREIVRSRTDAVFVMVGDRETDFLAADEVGIPSIGVRWGYGDNGELAAASVVVDRPDGLPQAIRDAATVGRFD